MIFVRDKGQMCNNILQYGHMYAWGREHGRKTVSMRFAYKYQYFHICNTRYHWFITYLFAKWGAALKLIPRVTFPFTRAENYHSQEQQLLSHKNCIAEGWRVEFPELFLKYKSEIKDLFQFKSYITNSVKAKMQPLEKNNIIRLGVHIRRGDYSRWMDGKYFYNDIVYATIMEKFIKMHTDKDVYVYISTNDSSVSEDKFRKLCSTPYIYMYRNNPAEDLCMLSMCDFIIGPPSTFSLVASLYNDAGLYWMMSSDPKELEMKGFKSFDDLFTQVL